MSDEDHQTREQRSQVKNDIIQDVLHEEDLYKILGASRSASAAELRRCYLERSKIVHPDKPPFHPLSTSAFQRLGFAFDILKSPSARRTYDRASKPASSQLPDKTTFLGGHHTFRSAVEAILQEFMTGDFAVVRRWLETIQSRHPSLVSEEIIINVERSFIRIRELVLTTRTYALLIYIELGRIHRVQKRLMGLGYLDVVGRARLTIHLVRVTLAVPMRVDRALKQREERAWRAKVAGLQAAGITPTESMGKAGILNDRVSQVLEFIVGAAGKDEGADEEWSTQAGATR
ncbi:DnaJ domain-containing protein [Phlyctema vagabunda]|uniref:DnaJ domain-containing protein n=1 Tax=Phlyctema vagabunda TaxID=108571 RepID=A0ABR4PS55_9HELO